MAESEIELQERAVPRLLDVAPGQGDGPGGRRRGRLAADYDIGDLDPAGVARAVVDGYPQVAEVVLGDNNRVLLELRPAGRADAEEERAADQRLPACAVVAPFHLEAAAEILPRRDHPHAVLPHLRPQVRGGGTAPPLPEGAVVEAGGGLLARPGGKGVIDDVGDLPAVLPDQAQIAQVRPGAVQDFGWEIEFGQSGGGRRGGDAHPAAAFPGGGVEIPPRRGGGEEEPRAEEAVDFHKDPPFPPAGVSSIRW